MSAAERAHRDHWGRLLALLAHRLGALDPAEEALQDAFATAVEVWAGSGVPDNPQACMLTVARRRALDRLRRDATLARKLPLLAGDRPATGPEEPPGDATDPIPDERRRLLLFTCCHPALAPGAGVTPTLRLVGGLSTAEIARAFLVPEPTTAARITRAKKKIAAARVPYRVPTGPELPDRLDGVLRVIYVTFSAGHSAGPGPRRPPRRPRPTVLLPDRDRTRWDTGQIREGSRWPGPRRGGFRWPRRGRTCCRPP